MDNLMAQIEALLYVAGDQGLAIHQMSELLLLDEPAVRQQIEQLQRQYQESTHAGLQVIQTGETFKLVTKAQHAALIKRYFENPVATTISQAALEVLAIIVYRQPITRLEIDEIRGVQSSGAIQTLQARQLIKDFGRKDAPGRPILYGTSNYFLDYFGLNTLNELPALEQLELSDQTENTAPIADLFYQKFESSLKKEQQEE